MKRVLGVLAILVGLMILTGAIGQKWIQGNQRFKVGQLVVGVIAGTVFLRQGWAWLRNIVRLDVMPVDTGDPLVAEAQQRAQASIETLWRHLAESRHDCFVKFPLRAESGHVEHIWGVVHRREGDGVVVSLVNQPVEIPAEGRDRRVVALRDIEDWQVMISDQEIRGGYSIAAMAQIVRSRGQNFSRADRRRLATFVDQRERLGLTGYS